MKEPIKFRKKPVYVEAIQWTGENIDEVLEFTREAQVAWKRDCLEIPALKGVMLASPCDWIVKGEHGEIYPCEPDLFAASYEKEICEN